MHTALNIAQTLRGAADLIEQTGWTRGERIASNGARDVVGAIRAAHHPRPTSGVSDEARTLAAGDALDMLVLHLARHAEQYGFTGRVGAGNESPAVKLLTAWNDHDVQHRSAVIAALNAAAEWAEHDDALAALAEV